MPPTAHSHPSRHHPGQDEAGDCRLGEGRLGGAHNWAGPESCSQPRLAPVLPPSCKESSSQRPSLGGLLPWLLLRCDPALASPSGPPSAGPLQPQSPHPICSQQVSLSCTAAHGQACAALQSLRSARMPSGVGAGASAAAGGAPSCHVPSTCSLGGFTVLQGHTGRPDLSRGAVAGCFGSFPSSLGAGHITWSWGSGCKALPKSCPPAAEEAMLLACMPAAGTPCSQASCAHRPGISQDLVSGSLLIFCGPAA